MSYRGEVKYRGTGGWMAVDTIRFPTAEEAYAWASYINTHPKKLVRAFPLKRKPTHNFVPSTNSVERVREPVARS